VETITLGRAVRAGALRHPDKPAVIVEELRWTYAELDAAVDRLAQGLIAFGIKPGDRVALHFTNGIDVVVSYQACFRAGAIAVPLNTRMKGPELQYVLNHSGARLYLGQPGLFAEIDSVRSGVESGESYFLSGEVSAAFCQSASANTMLGDLPPNSREIRLISRDASPMILEPMAVEPVKDTFRTKGCVTSASPMAEPEPGSTCSTPGGSPAP
jgi:acyl-CoA synthetase (AMP-forming)/AMP-acid ligase II